MGTSIRLEVFGDLEALVDFYTGCCASRSCATSASPATSISDTRCASACCGLQRSEGPIEVPLVQHPWGLTNFRLLDPEGYYLRLTS